MMASLTPEQAQSGRYGPVERGTLTRKFSTKEETKGERSNLQIGLVRPRELPAEGIYHIAISEVTGTENYQPLERGAGRTFAIASVLDLGLRMLESPRGRDALEILASHAIRVWHRKAANESPTIGVYQQYQAEQVSAVAAVSEYLHRIRARFPAVRLDRTNRFQAGDRNASHWQQYYHHHRHPHYAAEAFHFSTPSRTAAPLERSSQFNPGAVTATLHLDGTLVDKLYQARVQADLARRRRDEAEQNLQAAIFRRLQFHAATGMAHHLCHLFVGFLRGFGGLGAAVTDDDVLRLVRRHDMGAEFEVLFFGGRPKMFTSQDTEGRCWGKSYLVKRRPHRRRTAVAVDQERIERYLRGDFSLPLLTSREERTRPVEQYRDVKQRYTASEGHEGRRKVPNMDVVAVKSQQQLSLPWDIKGQEYQMLRRACFDPSVRVVDLNGRFLV
ncbi:hypothetical protein B0H63DRAFT_531315 [Podospora didyma]|uniref:Uncharacterized protein n=1 Tax=Podospora didyma TaxID=330526 RepID=A0AAE0P558_9PEZI|nr:hypothetical protein B0H63DRAFT_531315 [Podospora didyma]